MKRHHYIIKGTCTFTCHIISSNIPLETRWQQQGLSSACFSFWWLLLSPQAQKTATCVFIKANCGTNHDCFAPCKLKLKNDYCPGYAICDNGSSCCCQRIPNCGSPPLRKT
ncbi:hypothetical protein HKD37_03G008034 [Glycine soja]